jgi:hypothetical protein
MSDDQVYTTKAYGGGFGGKSTYYQYDLDKSDNVESIQTFVGSNTNVLYGIRFYTQKGMYTLGTTPDNYIPLINLTEGLIESMKIKFSSVPGFFDGYNSVGCGGIYIKNTNEEFLDSTGYNAELITTPEWEDMIEPVKNTPLTHFKIRGFFGYHGVAINCISFKLLPINTAQS